MERDREQAGREIAAAFRPGALPRLAARLQTKPVTSPQALSSEFGITLAAAGRLLARAAAAGLVREVRGKQAWKLYLAPDLATVLGLVAPARERLRTEPLPCAPIMRWRPFSHRLMPRSFCRRMSSYCRAAVSVAVDIAQKMRFRMRKRPGDKHGTQGSLGAGDGKSGSGAPGLCRRGRTTVLSGDRQGLGGRHRGAGGREGAQPQPEVARAAISDAIETALGELFARADRSDALLRQTLFAAGAGYAAARAAAGEGASAERVEAWRRSRVRLHATRNGCSSGSSRRRRKNRGIAVIVNHR